MQQLTSWDRLPADLKPIIEETHSIVLSYLMGLHFIVADTSRDPKYASTHLLYPLSQDILQSAMSILTLTVEGHLSVARRELRFLIEASIKIAAIQQQSYSSLLVEKLAEFDKDLKTSSISIKKSIDLHFLSEKDRAALDEEIGRLYGLTSKHVHLTPYQIEKSIEALKAGVTAGKERPEDITELNKLTERAMAISLVLLFHCVPSWVAGGWLVQQDGSSVSWLFMQSRFIAALDAAFDYKAERQERLLRIQELRRSAIRF